MPITAQWVVVPVPAAPATPAPAVRDVATTQKVIAHPFVRSLNDFATVSGDERIKAQVSQVLGTPIGTLPWRMDFGSDLQRLRHKSNTPILRETARVFVGDALKKWVPGVLVISTTPSTPAPNVVDLETIVQIGDKPQSVKQRL